MVIGQRSQVKGHKSKVTGQRSQAKGHRSKVKGHSHRSKVRSENVRGRCKIVQRLGIKSWVPSQLNDSFATYSRKTRGGCINPRPVPVSVKSRTKSRQFSSLLFRSFVVNHDAFLGGACWPLDATTNQVRTQEFIWPSAARGGAGRGARRAAGWVKGEGHSWDTSAATTAQPPDFITGNRVR